MPVDAVYGLFAQSGFLYNPRPHTKGVNTHNEVSAPTSITNQEKVPTELPTSQSDRGNSSVDISLFLEMSRFMSSGQN